MPPLVQPFPAADLPARAQLVTKDLQLRRRKGAPAGVRADLERCPLFEMVQYSCNPPSEEAPPAGVVRCESLVRLFRRCATVTVETTAWEKRGPLAQPAAAAAEGR